VPPRPVFWTARSKGVEPLLFLRAGSAPHSRRVRTAAAQRVRTARCNGDTPRLSIALGSAPASMMQTIVAVCADGFHVREPGRPTAGMQGLVAVAVSCVDVRARSDKLSNYFGFVRSGGDVQCGVACEDIPPDLVNVISFRGLTSRSRMETCAG
jgi:hypothetical protein